MMLMQVTCPHCGARYQFERSLIPQAGYDAQCANCSGIFVVASDASANEAPIALPSMSMIDTWLAPPALAPNSARTVAAQGTATVSRAAAGTSAVVEEVTPLQKPAGRAGRDGPATVTVLPVGGRGGPTTSVAPSEFGLQFSIACPSCETVYAFAANDVPMAGIDAPCTQCGHAYRLTRVGDPGLAAYSIEQDDDTVPAATELLRPLEPELLDAEKAEPEVGRVLAGLAEAGEPVAELLVSERPMTDGPISDKPTADRPISEPPIAAQPFVGASIAADPTASGPIDPPIPEEVTKPFARASGPSSAAAHSLDDAPTVVQPRDGGLGPRAIVPMAVSERSRAGAASWGPPDPPDPQAVMRSRVRNSGEGKERPKNRRPPFDDDDIARSRRDVEPYIDPREFDDEDSVFSRVGLRGKHRNSILGVTGLLLIAGLIVVMMPLVTGKSVLQVLHLRRPGDPRVQELTANARTALLADTDVGYRDAAKAANDILDIDPTNIDGRVTYGIASVFRGVDVRAAAQNMVAAGEVVQSSQMLATASAELAHARRVLSRKNDESAELAFTAGIYYALDEDQRTHARDAYLRGMKLSRVAPDAPPPTPYAAYLQASLRNLEGDVAGARAALERAMTLEPRWQRPRFELARLEAARGEVGRARELATAVLAANADHLKARDLLAVLPEAPPAPVAAERPRTSAPESTKADDARAAGDEQAKPEQAKPEGDAQAKPGQPKPSGDEQAKPEQAKLEGDAQAKPEPPTTPEPPRKGETPKAEQPRRDSPPPRPAAPQEPRDGAAPDIQTPPDSPTIIRGAPPPFQPPADPPPNDDGAKAPETQN